MITEPLSTAATLAPRVNNAPTTALQHWQTGTACGSARRAGRRAALRYRATHADVAGRVGTGSRSDVAVSDCSVSSEYGFTSTHAAVKITNSMQRTQSYLATIGVNDISGARIGEINVVSNSLTVG